MPASRAATPGPSASAAATAATSASAIGDSSSEPWWGACYGPDVDVVAPCLEIPTTDRLGGDGYDAGDYVGRFNGTSSATPHVAGLAALLFSLRPELTNVEVRRLIESTCDKISPALYTYANVGSKPTGTWNEEVGYGRVNAERALLAACAPGGRSDEACHGCGGNCVEPHAGGLPRPGPLPWLPATAAMFFYEARVFDAGQPSDRRLQIRVTYEHCLRLLGRQQGPLLYTMTLLPGEEVSCTSSTATAASARRSERLSVHSSFRQTMSALSQTPAVRVGVGVCGHAHRGPDPAPTSRSRPAAGSPASSARRR